MSRSVASRRRKPKLTMPGACIAGCSAMRARMSARSWSAWQECWFSPEPNPSSLIWSSFLKGAFMQPDPRIVWIIPCGAILLFVVRGIADFVSNYQPSWVGRQVIKRLRHDVFAHYLELPTRYLDQQQSGHLLSKLTYNVEMVAEAATSGRHLDDRRHSDHHRLADHLLFHGLAAGAFSIARRTADRLVDADGQSKLPPLQRANTNSMGEITRVAKESIDAHRLIKIFNAEGHQIERFEQAMSTNRPSNMKLARAKSISNPVVQLIAAIALASVLYVAISQVVAHSMEVDRFLGFLTALMLIPSPLRRLVNVSGPLQQGIAAGQSVFDARSADRRQRGTGCIAPRARRGRISSRVFRLRRATSRLCCTM